MRSSKTRKTEKKLKAKMAGKVTKELKAKRQESKEKLEVWKNLPESEWTEARKIRNGIKVETEQTI